MGFTPVSLLNVFNHNHKLILYNAFTQENKYKNLISIPVCLYVCVWAFCDILCDNYFYALNRMWHWRDLKNVYKRCTLKMLLVLFPSLKYDKIKMNSPTPFFRLLYPVRGICDFVLHTGLHLDHVISIFPDSFKWQEKSKIKQSAKVSSITLILILLVFFQPLTYKSYIIDIV